jgi:hypothetical protein
VTLAYKCKFCGEHQVVIVEDGVGQDYALKLAKLLACDACADRMEQKKQKPVAAQPRQQRQWWNN